MTELKARIGAAYALAEKAAIPLRHAEQVPLHYADITAEWMTDILCRDTPGAAVVAVRLGHASDGSSNRQRIFVEYNEAGRTAGLPASVFCKGAIKLPNRTLLALCVNTEGEPNFFSLIRPRIDVLTPPSIHVATDMSNWGYIVVMEDLTDRAIFPDETYQITRPQAEDMVRQLAALHGAFYDSPELGTESIPYKDWADWWIIQTTLVSDFGARCDQAVDDCESIIPPRLFARRAEIWGRTMEAGELHRQMPRMLTHCDVHLRNWFILDGKMGLCDWQVTQVGHWSRDFAYAMSTALTIDNRRAWLDDLLRVYLDELAVRGGERIDFERAKLLVRQQLAQALAFWTITYRPGKDMPDMQPDQTSLCFIERIAAAMDDLDALDSYG